MEGRVLDGVLNYGVYCIRDQFQVANSFVFIASSDEVALRHYNRSIRDSEYKLDFALWRVGSFTVADMVVAAEPVVRLSEDEE